MGYRDDFYIKENIFGFTGGLRELPSVYFMSDTEVGHITQNHPIENNIGREVVLPLDGYRWKNEFYDGKMRLVERWPFGKHPSRNTLTLLAHLNIRAAEICAQSVWRFENLKRMSRNGHSNLLPHANIIDAVLAAEDV